jgi:hypothetical protein
MMYLTFEEKSMIEAYQRVIGLEPTTHRLARGTQSLVVPAGSWRRVNWLQKSAIPGNDTISWEFRNQTLLAEAHLGPEVDEEEGVFGHPDSFFIELINNAATARDYLEAAALGLISPVMIEGLGQSIGSLLSTFWGEWTHGDLHLRNIVIGYERGQGWRPYIIDTAAGYRDLDSDRQEFADQFQLIESELDEPEEEMRWFLDKLVPGTWDQIHRENGKLGAPDPESPVYLAFQSGLERNI